MHEVPIVQELLQAVLNKSAGRGVRKVTRISLSIGEASGVTEENMRRNFVRCSNGTIAEGSRLVFEKGYAELHCRMCGASAEVTDDVNECPRCGMTDFQLIPDRTISVKNIEVQL